MQIVNISKKPSAPYIYVGRRMGGKIALDGSPLGNPFKLSDKSPQAIAECLSNYREWLWEKIQANDKQVMALMNEINQESTLACWWALQRNHQNQRCSVADHFDSLQSESGGDVVHSTSETGNIVLTDGIDNRNFLSAE